MEKDFDQMVAEAIVDTFYVPNPKFTTETVCRYNGAVDCDSKGPKCRRCGFNPYNVTLHNERVERALKRREVWLRGGW